MSSSSEAPPAPLAPPPRYPASPGAPPPPPPPFKLRFAPPRPVGRSRVAAHRPLALPCTITDKFYARSPPCDEATVAREQFAEQRVRRMFADRPSDKSSQPLTSQHEYGWYLNEDAIVNLMQWQRSDPACRLMRHPIREILNQK